MSAWSEVVSQAGLVAYPLLFVSFSLGAVICLRVNILRRGFSGSVSRLVERTLAIRPRLHDRRAQVVLRFIDEGAHLLLVHRPVVSRLDGLAERASRSLGGWRQLLRALVVTAPLLGLLGTVTGMIETFGSLHGGALALTGRGSVTGGISTALVSTQLGLAVGLPGLVFSRVLERREARRRAELFQARSILAEHVVGAAL